LENAVASIGGDPYCGKTDPTAVHPNRTGVININYMDA
jgi:hypothetical protein